MKLKTEEKQRLVAAGKDVYSNYLVLDFFKNESFTTNDGSKINIFAESQKLILNQEKEKIFIINNHHYKLILDGQAPFVNVSFKKVITQEPSTPLKEVGLYTENEKLNLLANQEFIIEEENNELYVSKLLPNKIKIGGVGKIDLYRSHLLTLFNIIQKIQSEEDISNLLVALATGSGKTYVQALWCFVLNLSDNNAIFGIPDKLVTQFTRDLKKLLPNEVLQHVGVIRQGKKTDEDEKLIDKCKNGSRQIIIASSEQLLDDHYHSLLTINSDTTNPANTFLSFDEQHLLMRAEKRRVRLIELSKHILSMFLTATPNKETYALAGYKPVAIMSSGQKQKSGQGQFPELYTLEAQNISDKNTLKNYRFWTAKFWQNMLRGALLRFSDAIQEQQSSVGVSIVEDLPFIFHRKSDESNPRWSMQVPMARKMLVIVDDNETLVNFVKSVNNPSDYNIYHAGNIVDRQDISHFFGIPNVEPRIINDTLVEKRQKYLANFQSSSAEEYTIALKQSDMMLPEQIKYTICHNMMEYILTDLTGLTEIAHNKMRKDDPMQFQKMIREKLTELNPVRDNDYYFKQLIGSIDEKGAKEVSKLLTSIYGNLQAYNCSKDPVNFNSFVDNWYLNRNIVDEVLLAPSLFIPFEEYVDSHLMVGIMKGMENAETPISASKPFQGLNKTTYRLYDKDGNLSDEAKKRKLTSLEILNDESTETTFTPNYLDITEDQCDNYFRLGFVGILVSNNKTEGFSDIKLNTVINLTEDRLDPNNSPDDLIQGVGRNRGLDETIIPAYIHARGRKQKGTFDLNNLNKDDYYPDLFKAQAAYNKDFINILGKEVTQEILDWYSAKVAPDQSIDEEKLKREVLKIIARALRKINNKNDHNIKLSRSELRKVINIAMASLDKEIKRTKNPYKLTRFVTVLGSLLNFICEIYYSFKRIPAYYQRLRHRYKGPKQAQTNGTSPDDVYNKILDKISYKKLAENLNIAKEFKTWIKRDAKGAEYQIKRNSDDYLSDEVNTKLNSQKQKFVWPLLSKFVTLEKREMLQEALKNFPYLLTWCDENQSILMQITDLNVANFKETILPLLQQIPGLETLILDDIIDYPALVNEKINDLRTAPFEIVSSTENRGPFAAELASYLKHSFLEKASAFFTVSDYNRFCTLLKTDNNAERFANHLLSTADIDQYNLSSMIEVFKTFFKLDDFTILNGRIDEFSKSVSSYFQDIKNRQIDEKEINEFVHPLKNQILPSLVNYYPLDSREKLLNSINDEKLKEIIIKNGIELAQISQPYEQAAFIFSRLTTETLPEQIKPEEEAQKAFTLLSKRFSEILNTSGSQKGQLVVKSLLNPSQWVARVKNSEYIFDIPVKEFIESDEFINSISLFFPYPQWCDLRDKLRKKGEVNLRFSRALIDSFKVNSLTDINNLPQVCIPLINETFKTNYEYSKEVAENESSKLITRLTSLQENLLNRLNDKDEETLSKMVHQMLLPLMASFIKDPIQRERFTLIKKDKVIITDFFYKNYEILPRLESSNEEEALDMFLPLINELSAPKQFTLNDLVHPFTEANKAVKIVEDDLLKISLTAYLTSNHCLQILETFFNPDDYSAIRLVLENDIEKIVDACCKQGIDTFDEESLITIFKTIPSLQKVTHLNKRAIALTSVIESIFHKQYESLEPHKVADLIENSLTPSLFHKDFYKCLNKLMGYLTEADLALIIEKLDEKKSTNVALSEAKLIKQFMLILKTKNKDELKKYFLTLTPGITDFEELPLAKTITLVGDILEEVSKCHCIYNNHDIKGQQGYSDAPKIFPFVSPELQEIKVKSNGSFMSYFSRKIFFIQAVRNSLPNVSKINGDSNHQSIKNLRRVKNHILGPIGWRTNLASSKNKVVKAGKDVAFKIKKGGQGVVKGLKRVFKKGSPKTSKTHSISKDYNDSAYNFSEKINRLSAFNAATVEKHDCPPDVVTMLEEVIPSAPIPRFFSPSVKKPKGNNTGNDYQNRATRNTL